VTQDEIVYTLTPDAMTLGVKVAHTHICTPRPLHVCTPRVCIGLNASRAAGLRPPT
jgi:hypothetical protein